MSAVSRILLLALACAAGAALPQDRSAADAEATLSAVVSQIGRTSCRERV